MLALIDGADNNHIALDFVALAKTPDGKQVDQPMGKKFDTHLTGRSSWRRFARTALATEAPWILRLENTRSVSLSATILADASARLPRP